MLIANAHRECSSRMLSSLTFHFSAVRICQISFAFCARSARTVAPLWCLLQCRDMVQLSQSWWRRQICFGNSRLIPMPDITWSASVQVFQQLFQHVLRSCFCDCFKQCALTSGLCFCCDCLTCLLVSVLKRNRVSQVLLFPQPYRSIARPSTVVTYIAICINIASLGFITLSWEGVAGRMRGSVYFWPIGHHVCEAESHKVLYSHKIKISK